MIRRLFGKLIFVVVLLLAVPCFSQGQDKAPTPSEDKSVEWVDIRVPRFPPLANQARIIGTVAIEVRFKGCELDPSSLHLVSGHPMLAPAAMESLKQSTFRCGDLLIRMRPCITSLASTPLSDFANMDSHGWMWKAAIFVCWRPYLASNRSE
jgi:hypothetical protein